MSHPDSLGECAKICKGDFEYLPDDIWHYAATHNVAWKACGFGTFAAFDALPCAKVSDVLRAEAAAHERIAKKIRDLANAVDDMRARAVDLRLAEPSTPSAG